AIRTGNGEIAVGLDRVIGGHDETGSPVNATRRDAGPSVHRVHGTTGVLHGGRELFRETDQFVHVIPPRFRACGGNAPDGIARMAGSPRQLQSPSTRFRNRRMSSGTSTASIDETRMARQAK